MLSHSLRALLKKNQPFFAVPFHFSTLLSSCSSLSQLTQVHALILTNGYQSDLLISTKLINNAILLAPTMEYARKVFDTLPNIDLILWNTLIRSYSHLGPCEEAIYAYRNMHQSGILPDSYTFPLVVRSCAVLSALREGKEVHCHVIKHGFEVNMFVQSSLVTMYAQNGVTLDAERAFGDIIARNVVNWTAMVATYVQNGYLLKGLKTFVEMVGAGTKPNFVTLVTILPACANLKFLNFGKLIHGLGIKLGVDSYNTLVNSLIALYGKCGKIDIARSLFDQIKVRKLVSWNCMIAAYEQNDTGGSAIKLFQKMQREKIEFDFITMVSVISACAGLGALNFGKWVHELVKSKGLEVNVSITNALIDMYAKCGNIDLAKDVFNSLPHRSVVSWTSIIGACASHGHGKEAIFMFSKMKKDGIRPNSLTFLAVLTACRHSGLVEEGRHHFQSMSEDYLIIPSLDHCISMTDLLGRAGKLQEAYEFIEKLPIEPDVDVWGALLSACRIHGNLELAERVAHRLYQLDPQNVNLYLLMINIYAEAGRWDDATRLKTLLDEMELKRTCGQSLVEVHRVVNKFLPRSRSRSSCWHNTHTSL